MSRELDVGTVLGGLDEPVGEDHRAGLVALVGRPNTGKSTLLNRVLGEKVSIVTQVPGTTRTTIRGVLTRDDAQLVLVDTPGLARPRTLLARRLNELVRDTWASVDLVCLLVDAAGGVGTGDAFLAAELGRAGVPVVAVANKIDLVSPRERLLPELERLSALSEQGAAIVDVVPVSAATGDNVERLLEVVVWHLPLGPRLLSPERVSDQPERELAAELLREKLIAEARDELPHSIAVTVDELRDDPSHPGLVLVDAVVHVERESQKGIVIGRGGERLKRAGTAARQELESLLGARVHLTTHVRVAKDWQRDPRQLRRLGF